MLFRVPKLARSRKRPPTGFLPSCQPILSAAAPEGDGWLHQIKYDGWRIIARQAQQRPRIWSRHMTDYSKHFSRVAAALAELPCAAVLDGEAVVFHQDGHSHFEALTSKIGGAGAAMVVFDVLEIDGEDVRKKPLELRRAILEELLSPCPDGIQLAECLVGNGPLIFQHACGLGLEGIVAKRLGSTYKGGPHKHWLKVKNPNFVRR